MPDGTDPRSVGIAAIKKAHPELSMEDCAKLFDLLRDFRHQLNNEIPALADGAEITWTPSANWKRTAQARRHPAVKSIDTAALAKR